MIRHLTFADYTPMPWRNGRGKTTEMIRVNRPDGRLLWRISMAMVTEEGPFSIFPETDRNLTVISGPGFDLEGAVSMRVDPLMPVSFPGDVAVSAVRVTGPSEDFNVMTSRGLPKPEVKAILLGGVVRPRSGQGFLIFAVGPAQVGPIDMGKHDMLVTDKELAVSGGPVLAVGMSV